MAAEADADFQRFVRARWHALVRTGFLLTGDQGRAEDLVQQTLVVVHRKWRSIEPGKAEAFARAVLVNQSASWWRRRRLREVPLVALAEAPAAAGQVVADPAARFDARDELSRALATLPPRMRAVIVLRYYTGLSEAETATTLGMSVGSVKSQASRGLPRLRTALTPTDTVERSR